MKYAHLAALVFNRPQLCEPSYLDQVGAYLLSRMRGTSVDIQMQNEPRAERQMFAPEKGTAIVPVIGTVTHRELNLDAESGPLKTSAEWIMRRMETLANDNRVNRIQMIFDTFGGTDAGVFEASRVIRDIADEMQVDAYIDEYALSAGYALASAATNVYLGPESSAGSIGVYTLHLDISKALENEGITPTLIAQPAAKVDGNPYGPLGKDERQDIQGRINEVYATFVATVAENRDMSTEDVRATNAGVYRGQAAVDAGLADAVATLRFPAPTEEASMPRRQAASAEPKAAQDDVQVVPDTIESLKIAHEAELEAVNQSGYARGHAEGVQAERERWSAALDGVEAHVLTTAVSMLGQSDMDADAVGKVLGTIKAPETPKQAVSQFKQQMDANENPDIDPYGDTKTEADNLIDFMVGSTNSGRAA